ncbi:MAG: hypothetical protein L0154_04355 [Chloroflexi bacterium]|nr:hypothetical protein [Chloroflexota bacterium]
MIRLIILLNLLLLPGWIGAQAGQCSEPLIIYAEESVVRCMGREIPLFVSEHQLLPDIALSPDGDYVVFLEQRGTVADEQISTLVYDMESENVEVVREQDKAAAVRWLSDNSLLISTRKNPAGPGIGSRNPDAHWQYSPKPRKLEELENLPDLPVVHYREDSEEFVVIEQGILRAYTVEGESRALLSGVEFSADDGGRLIFAPNNRYVAYFSECEDPQLPPNTCFTVYDFIRDTEQQYHAGADIAAISSAVVSPSGRFIAFNGQGKSILVFDMVWRELRFRGDDRLTINNMRWLDDETILYTASRQSCCDANLFTVQVLTHEAHQLTDTDTIKWI